jgi:hypothetical protein
MRAEISALTKILLDNGIMTAKKFTTEVTDEAKLLDRDMEVRFPGFKSTDNGITIDVEKVSDTMRHWKP